ncbi:MAG: ABC transporter permease [Oscillospiraceae bacterium]|nr:ABC transporter permease [Oscillospiraceae bacterium]
MKLKEFARNNRYTTMLIGLLVLVLAFFSATKGKLFWQGSLWQGMMFQFPEYGCMTLGLMFAFISGHMDMSFVMLGNFSSIIAVKYMIANVEEGMANSQIGGIILTAIGIALAIAVVGGIINSLLVSRLNIPPVMATIAMQLVWQGFSTALTKGYALPGLPSLYTEIGHKALFGFLPVPLLIFIVLFLVAAFLLKYTVFGEKLYMLGTNKKAAQFSAINVHGMLMTSYILSAVFSCVGTLIMVSTMGSAKADYGISYTMRCILILVLAGVLPDGGMGKIRDVLLAILTIQCIATGVNLFPSMNTYYGSLIWGGLLIIVLIASTKMTDNGPKKLKAPKKTTQKVA